MSLFPFLTLAVEMNGSTPAPTSELVLANGSQTTIRMVVCMSSGRMRATQTTGSRWRTFPTAWWRGDDLPAVRMWMSMGAWAMADEQIGYMAIGYWWLAMDYWLLICDASDGLRRATAIYSQGQPCMTGAFALRIADGIWPSLTHPAVGPFISGTLDLSEAEVRAFSADRGHWSCYRGHCGWLKI
jgi:hypothetical protein